MYRSKGFQLNMSISCNKWYGVTSVYSWLHIRFKVARTKVCNALGIGKRAPLIHWYPQHLLRPKVMTQMLHAYASSWTVPGKMLPMVAQNWADSQNVQQCYLLAPSQQHQQQRPQSVIQGTNTSNTLIATTAGNVPTNHSSTKKTTIYFYKTKTLPYKERH